MQLLIVNSHLHSNTKFNIHLVGITIYNGGDNYGYKFYEQI